jgi:hypothetical protein
VSLILAPFLYSTSNSSKDVMDEWLGRGRFVAGGIERFKNSNDTAQFGAWKSQQKSKRFSRINQLVTGVQNCMKRQGNNMDTVVERIDAEVKANGNGNWSINKAIDLLKKSGDISSKKRS